MVIVRCYNDLPNVGRVQDGGEWYSLRNLNLDTRTFANCVDVLLDTVLTVRKTNVDRVLSLELFGL